MPGLDPKLAKRVWRAGLRLVRQAVMDGHRVSLEEICTIEPYTKEATRGYNPYYKREQDVPATRYVRFEPSVRLVQALRRLPVQ